MSWYSKVFPILFLGTRTSRGNVMTGDLPEDFLRISPAMNQAVPAGQMPVQYFQPTAFMQPYQQPPSGRLSITVQQVFSIIFNSSV